MNIIEHEKEKLALLEKKETELLTDIKENYGLDDDDYDSPDSIVDGYISGEFELDWRDARDLVYSDEMVGPQKALVNLLKGLDTEDKKALHNINKAIESLARDARHIKQARLDDIKKAQEVITLMDEIIQTCDKYRK